MSKLQFRVIGSGDAFGSAGRLNTCFYVESQDTNFLIDCGASSLPALKKHNVETSNIDTILITHFHGDHYGGVPFLLLEAAVYQRKEPLTIISPPGCKEKVSRLLELLYPGSEVLEKLNINFVDYKSFDTVNTEHLSVQAFPVIHAEAALPHGLRIAVSDKIISYSGDTGWTENLVKLSENADLFVCECNFFKSKVKGHLNYETLQEKLGSLTCKRIVLTHFDDEMLKNLDEVSLTCAEDGMLIEIY